VSNDLSRRRFLHTSLGAAAVSGLGLAGLLGSPAAAAGPGAAAGDQAPCGCPDPDLPPVPGMLGDRLANEFWYQFDQLFMYAMTQEVADAFTAIDVYCASVNEGIAFAWLQRMKAPGYPGTYAEWSRPIAEPLATLSRLQLGMFDAYYCRHDPRLVQAFADFGQGVLYDPRRLPGAEPVHTGFGDPPNDVGYLFWWVFLRSMMLVGVDTLRWQEMAPRVAFAWQVQGVAKPNHLAVNPPLPRETLRGLARTWLRRSVEQLDTDFQTFPYNPPPMPTPQLLRGSPQ
jgi:hypothetical protein